MWRGRAEKWKWVAGWNDTEAKMKMTSVCACACVCVCAAAGVTPNCSPQWPMVNLRSNWLKVRKRWLIIGLLLTTLCMCVCMQTSVWKAAVFANALPLHPHHPRAPRARVPPRGRGIKEGRMHFDGFPPSHWDVLSVCPHAEMGA